MQALAAPAATSSPLFRPAHQSCRHTTASEHVRAANDKAFKALNEAYQSLMDGRFIDCVALHTSNHGDVRTSCLMPWMKPGRSLQPLIRSACCVRLAHPLHFSYTSLAAITCHPLQAPTAAGRKPGRAPTAEAHTALTRAATAAAMAQQAAERGAASTQTTTPSTAITGRAPAAATGDGSSMRGGAAQAWVSSGQAAGRFLPFCRQAGGKQVARAAAGVLFGRRGRWAWHLAPVFSGFDLQRAVPT